MNNTDLISIIVPVYNVENYIENCVNSLCNQNVKCAYEIILVDDGSTDGSGKVCEQLSRKFKNVKIYHKKNGGLSDARNYGIEKSSGNYLVFVDPDDYVDYSFLKVLYKMVSTCNVKLACVDGIRTSKYDDTFKKVTNFNKVRVIDKKEALKKMLLRDGFGVSAWAKIYHKSLFNDIKYPKGKLYEDILTTPYLIDKCDKIAFSGDRLYYYVVRSESITNRKISKKDFQMLEELYQIRDFILNKYSDLRDAYNCRYLVNVLGLINRVVQVDCKRSTIQSIMNKDSSIWQNALKNKYLDSRRKIQILVLKFSPKLYSKITSIILEFR